MAQKDKKNNKSSIGENFIKAKNTVVTKAYTSAKKFGSIIMKIFSAILNLIISIFTPIGLIVVLLLFIVWGSVSGNLVFGPIQFIDVCDEYGIPKVEELEGDDRTSASMSYFMENTEISKEAALFIAQIEDKSGYDKLVGANSEDCDLDCLIELSLDPNCKDKLSIGAFGLSGDNAYNLLMLAKDTGRDWKDPGLQMESVVNVINNIPVDEKAALKDSMQLDAAAKTIAKALGKTFSNTELNSIKRSVENKSKRVEKNKVSCTTMGSGKGRSRLHGGSSTDTSGGLFSNFAGLDFDDIVSFMNSFVEDKIVHPPIVGYNNGVPIYGTGMENANPGYIKAKRTAEKYGGKDNDAYWASCDRFVATVIKAMEIDVKFPWGGAKNQIDYMKNSKCWGQVNISDIQSGDVVGWNPAGKHVYDNHGHIGIYADDHFYEASYGFKYPHKWSAGKEAIIREIQKDPRPASVFRYNDSIPGCEIKRSEKSTKEKIIESMEEDVNEEFDPKP